MGQPTIQDPGTYTLEVTDCIVYAPVARAKGQVIKLYMNNSVVADVVGVDYAIAGDQTDLMGTWYGVVQETITAAGPIKLRVRGRTAVLMGVGTNGTPTTLNASWPLMLAADIDDLIAGADRALTPAVDMTLDSTVAAVTGYANTRKILGYSLSAHVATEGTHVDTAPLVMGVAEFNGIEGFGTVVGITDLT